MNASIDPDKYNRLITLIIERDKYLSKLDLPEAIEMALGELTSLKLQIRIGQEAKESIAQQAAILTAINCGKRAFMGGVYFNNIGFDFPCLVPGFRDKSLVEVMASLGAKDHDSQFEGEITLCFSCIPENENEIQVLSNGWRGGVIPFGFSGKLPCNPDFALGGVLAGSMATGFSFLYKTKLAPRIFDKPQGLSLWDLNSHWLDEGDEQEPTLLPEKLWIVGLGHLGQAYAWTISQLPYLNRSQVEITLQDFDVLVEANYNSGMLCDILNVGSRKTRIVSDWLETKGFRTKIVERPFDATIVPYENESGIIINGLDSISTRQQLKPDIFDLMIDCGLGGSIGTFDSIAIHNFNKGTASPNEIWSNTTSLKHKGVEQLENKLINCGTLAEKAISTAFVGTLSSTLVIAELLRAFVGAHSYSELSYSFRSPEEVLAKRGLDYDKSILINGVAKSLFNTY
ncbi:hypothetical protein [Ekhidna sp.]|uniref:hypothetical protein n=1 Tax=Ekhidna sp. TaxID=2608089 RepID=UPI003299FF28